MGLRATVIKEYKVEYGNTQGFNWEADTLANIFDAFCEDFYHGGEEIDTNAIWEIDKHQFEEMVKTLEAMPEDEFNQMMKEEWYAGYNSEPLTKEYTVKILKGFLSETTSNEYVRLGWL